MTRTLKLTIEYDGTHFQGWQIQAPGSRTVQGVLQQALQKICSEKVKLIGSGRTDSGVHAKGQAAHFRTESALPCGQLLKALNANLPKDAAVINCEEVKQNFHAQYSAKSKIYRYTIFSGPVRPVLDRDFVYFFHRKLNLKSLRQEAKALLGRHDFKAFQSSDPHRSLKKIKESTVRDIQNLRIQKKGDYIFLDIEASGFLYKMVRNIVGALLSVATGQNPKGTTAAMLKSKRRLPKITTAPALGLCLLKVNY